MSFITNCSRCKGGLGQGEGLREPRCGQRACPRCLAQLYLPHFLASHSPPLLEMHCGHFAPRLQVEAALADHCIGCGFRCRAGTDYQLQGAMKLCAYCFAYEGRQFQEFFQLCLSCAAVLKAGEAVLSSGLPICSNCSESQVMIEQSMVRTSKAETRQPSTISELRSEKFVVREEGEEEPSEQLSIVSRFSAFDIGEEEGKGGSAMRILSKNSVEIRVENFQLPPIAANTECQTRCELCCSYLPLAGTLPNTSLSSTRICKLCYTLTFDRAYITYTRYNNYTDGHLRTASLSRQEPPRQMKMSLLPAPAVRVQRREGWEVEGRAVCELCKARPVLVIRADKKGVCVQCRNAQG